MVDVPVAFMVIAVIIILAIVGVCAVFVWLLVFKLVDWLLLQQDTAVLQKERVTPLNALPPREELHHPVSNTHATSTGFVNKDVMHS